MSKAFLVTKYTPSILLLSISMPITRVETWEIKKKKKMTFLFWIQTDYHILISNNYIHLILELSCSILPSLVKETVLEFMGSSIIPPFYVGTILVICPLQRHFFSYHHWRQLDWIFVPLLCIGLITSLKSCQSLLPSFIFFTVYPVLHFYFYVFQLCFLVTSPQNHSP